MSERTAVRASYDAVVDLHPGETIRTGAYGLVKFTFEPRGGRAALAPPVPLQHDIRDQDADPRVVPGTDFWPFKAATDVVVQGSAFAPGGRPTPRMEVSVALGEAAPKRIAVFGDRTVRWEDSGRVRFGLPQPFEQIPLTWDRAYGGVDLRVPLPEPLTDALKIQLHYDHPGMYPRNPFGRGYLVEDAAVADFLLPNLEDPDDLLADGRLITRDPRLWYTQPLPWSCDWVHPVTFPRHLYMGLGVDAWYPGPQDRRMPEVERGYLRNGYRDHFEQHAPVLDPAQPFMQGASHGMTISDPAPGLPIRIRGMHPELAEVVLPLPERTPWIELLLEGRPLATRVRMHHVVCHPAEMRYSIVYGAEADLPRGFMPGVHRRIPLAVRVGEDEPVEYEAPDTIEARLEAGTKTSDGNGTGTAGAEAAHG